MKARERFNKILLASRDRIQEEVSALIGKTIKLGDAQFRQMSKEELFAGAEGKQVLAHVRLEGEIQGDGCLLVGIKDAIYIGGTLIMLPESELQSVLAEQQYSEELEDSFGEVANIICGAATVTFEEQYPKSVRLIRTEQEVISPTKVENESDQPIADVPYYLMTAPMQLENRELGHLHLVLPAEPFGLVEESVKEKAAQQPAATPEPSPTQERQENDASQADGVLASETDASAGTEEAGVLERSAPENVRAEQPAAQPAQPKRDVGKQKKLVDDLLRNAMAKMSEEVSALLGGTLKVTPEDCKVLTKEQFLDQAGGKQIMSRMELRGGGGGEAYLFVDVKTAVYLGGALIMLPESELEETARNEEFGDDARDAYGEVTNIVAGVYTAIFEEQYRSKIGFVKTSMEQIVPLKVDPDSDEAFVNQAYYLSTGLVQYNNRDLGRLQLLIPAHVLELEALLQVADDEPLAAELPEKAAQSTPSGEMAAAGLEPARLREKQAEDASILLFTDDDDEANRIADVLEEMGYISRILHFKDPVNSVLTTRIQMVFLVMREASEQGFGVAIKISSAGLPVPLVAAGPAWTRTMVLKAVKYGACDILVTPSLSDDVRQKIEVNLLKKAA